MLDINMSMLMIVGNLLVILLVISLKILQDFHLVLVLLFNMFILRVCYLERIPLNFVRPTKRGRTVILIIKCHCMAKNLVIVESPAKAKTIEGYLGKDFVVKSSFGHVRDLAKKGEAIDIENGFEPQYKIAQGKKKVIVRRSPFFTRSLLASRARHLAA